MHPALATASTLAMILIAQPPYLGGLQVHFGYGGRDVIRGCDWTATDTWGRYEIAMRNEMNAAIMQPAGWRVPTVERQLPQFFSTHKPRGFLDPLRYGRLNATDPAPERVNFPLVRRETANDDVRCLILGGTLTHADYEIGWLRDGPITDLTEARLDESDFMLHVNSLILLLIERRTSPSARWRWPGRVGDPLQ